MTFFFSYGLSRGLTSSLTYRNHKLWASLSHTVAPFSRFVGARFCFPLGLSVLKSNFFAPLSPIGHLLSSTTPPPNPGVSFPSGRSQYTDNFTHFLLPCSPTIVLRTPLILSNKPLVFSSPCLPPRSGPVFFLPFGVLCVCPCVGLLIGTLLCVTTVPLPLGELACSFFPSTSTVSWPLSKHS